MLREKQVVSILNKHKKRDDWFLTDYSANPYEGCSCNCLYCYIRGSKYGENMSDHLSIKTNALEVFEKQLRNRAKKNQYGFIAVGSATDAYIQHEEKYGLTRGFLELILKYRFPVFISTKRHLIKRDVSILRKIDKAAILPDDLKSTLQRGVILSVSISTMNEVITNMLEPGAIRPLERLKLLEELKSEGFLTGVNAIPILPYISDTDEELEKIVTSSKEHKADYILIGGLTLLGNGIADSKTLYYKFLEKYDQSLVTAYEHLYVDNFYTPRSYQNALAGKAKKLCAKHQIRTTIVEL